MTDWQCQISFTCVSPTGIFSVKHVDCDKMKESSAQIFIPHERAVTLVLWQEEWLVGATPSTCNFGSNWLRWSENTNFQSIFARSSSAITPSKKSWVNTNRNSTTCLTMSLRWTSCVAPKHPKGRLKNVYGCFPSKKALRLKKVCYKVSLCENRRR